MDGIQQGYLGVTGASPLNFGPPVGLGNLPGGPWSGLIGSGIGGVLGGQNMGRTAQELGGLGAGIPMAQTDPVAAAYAQQAQLALQSQLLPPQLVPQGIAGYGPGFLSQAGIGGIFANPHFAGIPAGLTAHVNRGIPYPVDPFTAALLQQGHIAQLAHGTQFGGAFANPLAGGLIGQTPRWTPYEADPFVLAAWAQQAHFAQQAQLAQLAQQAQLARALAYQASPYQTFPHPVTLGGWRQGF